MDLLERCEQLSGRTWKIPPVPVPSDDCVIHVGRQYGVLTDGAGDPVLGDDGTPKRGVIVEGVPYSPHAGETVWLIPTQTMDAYLAFVELNRVNAEFRLDTTFADRQQKAWRALAEKLAGHIAAWDWTDAGSDPLPQPYKNPDVLIGLDNEEFMWLMDAVQAGPPAERKNGHAPSPNTSSAKGQRQQKPSLAGSPPASATLSPAPS